MFRKSAFVMAILVIAIGAWNYLSLQKNIAKIITSDPRNDGISVFVHYQWFINPNVIVFDLRDISPTKSPMDVSRALLQLSEQLQEKSYNRVILAFKGDSRFILKGSYFSANR